MTSNYENISSEYYDGRHITSRNFDLATSSFFKSNLPELPKEGLVVEFGAGRGRSNEFCNIDSKRVIQTDISEAMLNLQNREDSLLRVVTSALSTPFTANSFSIATAFLYDPYNIENFYIELNRVLKIDGIFIGTLPHFKWGSALRSKIGYKPDKTRFLDNDGKFVELDSHLLDDSKLNKIFSRYQFHSSFFDAYLPESCSEVSPHIRIVAQDLNLKYFQIPIVQIIIARKI